MSFASEFREFAVKGNVVDLAVGVIIGAAFGKIVDSLVKDLVMPIVGAIFGGLDFSNYFIPLVAKLPDNVPRTYEALTKAGVPLFAYGKLIHDVCWRREHHDKGHFVRAWGDKPPGNWLALGQVVLCVALFVACAMHVRLRLRHKSDAALAAATPTHIP